MAEVVEGLCIADGAGEVAQVLLHEVTGFVVRLRVAVVDVVIPVEACLALALDAAHHGVLHAVQHVEARKDDGALALEKLLDEAFVGLHLLRDMTEECALPELALGKHPFVQQGVYLEHVAPRVQELLLQPGAAVQGETSEEALQRLPLVVIEVVQVLEAFLVGDVGEDGLCICQMLVDVVEVGHQHFAPAPELVERLGVVSPEHFLHDAVQMEDAFQRLSHLERCERLEEVVHHAVAGRPNRLVAQERQFTAQEHPGSLAREDYRHVAHVVREVRQHISCYETKEGVHNF